MKYINPLSFLQLSSASDINIADKKNLLLQKKKLLAEIELSDDKTVVIDGATLTKNDLLQMFDRLQESDELTYHTAIAQDKVLTDFLDNGVLPLQGRFLENDLYNNASFIHFIAPYYEEIFTRKALEFLKDLEVEHMQDLFANPVLLDGEAKEKSYTRIMRYLLQKKSYLLQTKETLVVKKKATLDDVLPYIDNRFITILNLLPEEFNEFKNDYGLHLINTGIDLQRINLRLALGILATVRLLNCNDYIRQQNEERFEILQNNLSASTPKRKWRWGYFGFFILFRLIYAFSTCNDSTNHSSSGYSSLDTFNSSGSSFPTNTGLSAEFNSNKTFNLSTNFVTALGDLTSTSKNFVGSGLYTNSNINSGTNIYKESFSVIPHVKKLKSVEKKPVKQFIVDSVMEASSSNNQQKNKVLAKPYQEEMKFENETDFAVVAIVQTEDSIYSCYIRPHDYANVKVTDGLSVMYFYFGRDWDASQTLIAKRLEKNNLKEWKIKGAFKEITPATNKFLHEPYYIKVDDTISSTQDHRSFFTFQMKGNDPEVYFETLSSLRVTVEKGSLDN